jgi:hypothetical protein
MPASCFSVSLDQFILNKGDNNEHFLFIPFSKFNFSSSTFFFGRILHLPNDKKIFYGKNKTLIYYFGKLEPLRLNIIQVQEIPTGLLKQHQE